MVQTSRKIQQSIDQLQQQTIRLGDELQSLYEDYFDILGDACQRQLVLAAYHICTQVYPEAFLHLKYNQREKLQKTLQQLGSQVQEQLQERWQQAQQASHQSLQNDGLALIKQLFMQAEASRTEAASSSQRSQRPSSPGHESGNESSEPPLSPRGDTPPETESGTSSNSDLGYGELDGGEEGDASSAASSSPNSSGAGDGADDKALQRLEDELGDWLSGVESADNDADADADGNADGNADAQPSYRVLKVEETTAGTNISFVDEEDSARASLRDRLLAKLSAYQAGRDEDANDEDVEDETETRSGEADIEGTSGPEAESRLDSQTSETSSEISNGSDVGRADSRSESESGSKTEEPAKPVLSEPTQLLRLQLFTEKAIRDVLKTISETANYLLQQEKIVPEMPKALLAAAAESDGLSQTPMKTPNLLRISVRVLHDRDDDDDEDAEDSEGDASDTSEMDDSLGRRLEQLLRSRAAAEQAERSGRAERSERAISDDDETGDAEETASNPSAARLPRVLQIESLPEFIVIHLRLSEIEFADPRTAAQRRQLRAKMNDLKKLGRAYKQAQRQLAVAQAEDAWRASWIE